MTAKICGLFLGSGRNCGLELGHVGRHMTTLDAEQLNVSPQGMAPLSKGALFHAKIVGDSPAPPRDPETDPIISCTEKQLAFYFWQHARGSDDLDMTTDEGKSFCLWWDQVVLRGQDLGEPPNFATIRDLCLEAWRQGGARTFADRWAKIVADGRGYGT